MRGALAFGISILSVALGVGDVRAEPNKAQYELQERCGESAAKWFRREWSSAISAGQITTYENHYNRKLDRCMVLVSLRFPDSLLLTLLDLNERKTYGDFNGSISNPPIWCYVGEKQCRSEVEWRTLGKRFLEE
jgi:hypothetical protein